MPQSKDKPRNRRYIFFLLPLLLLAAGLTVGAAFAGQSASTGPKSLADPPVQGKAQSFDSSQIEKLGSDRQGSAHAAQLMAECDKSKGIPSQPQVKGSSNSQDVLFSKAGPLQVTATSAPPSPTPTTVCVGITYQTFTNAAATMIPATNDTGIHCDDCNANITLPFPVTVYGTVFTSAYVGSNGMLDFASNQPNIYTANCLPVLSNPPAFSHTLFAYYDDLRTDVLTSTHGIYRATFGTAPNRDFVLRWQATYFNTSITEDANFEVVLHENSPNLTVIYGTTATTAQGARPASGIQLNLGQYTSYSCHTDIPAGTMVTYVPIGCGVTPTLTPTLSPTVTPTPSCTITFSDVHPTDYFYEPVRYLYCHGVISGYADGTFRPFNNTTRSQMVKIVVLGFGVPISTPTPVGAYTFTDVPPSNPFFSYVETAASHNIVSGYTCGGPGEPCDPQNRPYFRPYANVTRGQLSKIDVIAAGWPLVNPASRTFEDVFPDTTFYQYIETAYCHGVISGYNCGGPGEPCGVPPRPYFRQQNDATRGQISKIVYLSITNTGPCVVSR
jgi:hypothetical protein